MNLLHLFPLRQKQIMLLKGSTNVFFQTCHLTSQKLLNRQDNQSMHNSLPIPAKQDWWYHRTASVLKKIYQKGPIGVSKLRTLYGGKRNRGAEPEKFYRAGGNIVRKILQDLEKAGLAKQVQKGVHKGRIITPKGKSMVDKVAKRLYGQPRGNPEKKA